VEELLSAGHEVRALVRETSDCRWIQGLPVERCCGDVAEPASLRSAVEGQDWIFHVAGVTKAQGFGAYLLANAEGTRHLLEACVSASPPPSRVVVVSSLAAWGPCSPDHPRDESEACSPVSHYGKSKALAERIAGTYADRLPIVVLRPTAVYGPRDRDVLEIFRLVRRGWFLSVGAGERHICMLHVRDLAAAGLLAARAPVPSGATYALSDGENRTWSDVVGVLERIMGVKARTIRIPVSVAWAVAAASEGFSAIRGVPPLLNRQKVREMTQSGWTCDIGRAVAELQFQPRVPLEQGLEETYRWYRDAGWM
jgi:nucleoside-diphosphate-sugar epimerase